MAFWSSINRLFHILGRDLLWLTLLWVHFIPIWIELVEIHNSVFKFELELEFKKQYSDAYCRCWIYSNLWRFKVMHQIDADNSMSNFYHSTVQFLKMNWIKDRFNVTSIFELSDGDNLGHNDNFLMIFWVDFIAQAHYIRMNWKMRYRAPRTNLLKWSTKILGTVYLDSDFDLFHMGIRWHICNGWDVF